MPKNKPCILFCLFLWLHFGLKVTADTISTPTVHINANLSGSALNAVNWNGMDENHLYFSGSFDLEYERSGNVFQKLLILNNQLGYTHYIDSTWIKDTDQLKVQLLVRRKGKKITQSFSVFLVTQYMTCFIYEDDRYGKLKRIKSASFMNPADVELGYGTAINLKENNFLNISFGTVRISAIPSYLYNTGHHEEKIATVGNGFVLLDYGLSGQLQLRKIIMRTLEWNCIGKFFVNGFNKSKTTLDILNRISWKAGKFFEIRTEMKCVFDPVISEKLQYRNELLMGIFYETTR